MKKLLKAWVEWTKDMLASLPPGPHREWRRYAMNTYLTATPPFAQPGARVAGHVGLKHFTGTVRHAKRLGYGPNPDDLEIWVNNATPTRGDFAHRAIIHVVVGPDGQATLGTTSIWVRVRG